MLDLPDWARPSIHRVGTGSDAEFTGFDAVGMTTRYIGNESTLLLENCVIDIGSVIRHLRNEGYRKIVLVGNSGGGGLVALYQDQAEHPTITGAPAGGPPDLTRAGLLPADALGRARSAGGATTSAPPST